MTPPRRKTAFIVAGYVGAIAAGFASHWAVPLVSPSGNAAQAAPENSSEKRLQAIEQKQGEILTELRDIRETLGFVRGRLNIASGK